MRARCGSAMLPDIRAGHGQKPREVGGRDYPLKLGPELGLSRSGLTSFGTTFVEMTGFAEPRASEPAMKDALAELRQSCDDWNAQAEIQWRACNPETLRFTARDLSIISSRTTSKLSRWP